MKRGRGSPQVADGRDADAPGRPEQLSLGRLLVYFLAPGVLVTLLFAALGPAVSSAGLPPLAALLTAAVLVIVPLELGIVLWAGRRTGSLLGAVTYRRPMAWRTWLWLSPTLIVLAFVGFGLVQALEPTIISTFFGWLPRWFVSPIDFDAIGSYSRSVWLATLGAFLVINGFVGPIVEELYFRGFLLPRMEWMGRWAPLVNVSLFSLYHFFSPWQFLARVVGFGPTVYAVRWKENVLLGIVVHCSLNTISVLVVTATVLGRS